MCAGDFRCAASRKKLFCLLTALYAVAALYLILNVDTTLRADAKSVFNAAKAFRLGDCSMLQKGGYIYRYPHQLGLMLYDCILMLFRADPAFNFVMNFVFVIGINHLSCKISDALFHDKAVNLLTIVCTFAFCRRYPRSILCTRIPYFYTCTSVLGISHISSDCSFKYPIKLDTDM